MPPLQSITTGTSPQSSASSFLPAVRDQGVSVIILIQTSACLERLLLSFFATNTYHPIEVIIIDHGDDVETKEVLSRYSTRGLIHYIHRGTDSPYPQSANYGAQKARYPYLLFLDPDIEYTADVLPAAWATLEKSAEVGAIGVRNNGISVSHKSNQPQSPCRQNLAVIWKARQGICWPEMLNAPSLERSSTDGDHSLNKPPYTALPAAVCCLLLCRKTDFNYLSGFAKEYQTSIVFLDFCLRLHEHCLKDIVCLINYTLARQPSTETDCSKHWGEQEKKNLNNKTSLQKNTPSPYPPGHLEKKIIVYTCNFGNYDSFKEPLQVDSRIKYILFTDNKEFSSSQWNVVHIEDKLDNPRRTSRLPKMLPHKYLPEHDISIYMDASLTIREADVVSMAENCLHGQDIAAYPHFDRDCVYDEIDECLRQGKADPTLTEPFRKCLEAEGFPRNYGLVENAFIVRRNTKTMRMLNEAWHALFSRGEERDQFYLMYLLWAYRIPISRITNSHDFRKSPYLCFKRHKWKAMPKAYTQASSNNVCRQNIKNSDHAVLIHVYHLDVINDLKLAADRFPEKTDIYVSYPETASISDIEAIKEAFPYAELVQVKNCGQDIGAFFQLLEHLKERKYSFFCKLHSKKGNKKPAVWRAALLDGVAGTQDRIKEFVRLFRKNDKLIYGGPKELFLYGPKHLMGNEKRVLAAKDKLGLLLQVDSDPWGFFAGSCFWIQSSSAYAVAKLHSIEDFEDSGVKQDGQLAHALERVFGMLAAHGQIALASSCDVCAAIEIHDTFPKELPHRRQFMNEILADVEILKKLNVIGRKGGARGFQRIAQATRRIKFRDTTVLTPTGDRHVAFAKCLHWVKTQTVRPGQWVIVDDGKIPLHKLVPLPEWVTYVRRTRLPGDPPHTLSMNILAGLEEIDTEKVVIMEDDDWYAPNYIEYMSTALNNFDIVGLNRIHYYLLPDRQWKHGKPRAHTALAQTAFRMGTASEYLRRICEEPNSDIQTKGIVDRYWWQGYTGRKWLIADHPNLHVGLKGGFGRPGLAEGHKVKDPGYNCDNQKKYLPGKIGADHIYYRRWQRREKNKFVIYTAIAGGFDNLKQPLAECKNFDFFVFSDTELETPGSWQVIPFDERFTDATRTAKKPKILPHLYFPEYEWSIWIDANLFILQDLDFLIKKCEQNESLIGLFEHPERNTVRSEAIQLQKLSKDDPKTIQQQFEHYVDEGWEEQIPLYECNIIVRRHNNHHVMRAMKMWWDEIQNNSRRDQISFPYVMWRTGLYPLSLLPKGLSARNIPAIYYPIKPTHGHIEFESIKDKIEMFKARFNQTELRAV